MTISFARHQFPPVIIRRAVWLCLRFTLSYRDVEDLLAESGLDVSYEAEGFTVPQHHSCPACPRFAGLALRGAGDHSTALYPSDNER